MIQDVACGMSAGGKAPRNAMIDLIPLLLDSSIL